MLKSIKTIALSALIGLGALAAIPAAAQADGLYFSFGDRAGPSAGIVIGESGGVRHWDRDRDHRDRDWRDRDHRNSNWRSASACSPDRALNKASRMGINRVRLDDVNRSTITVRGRDNGQRVYVTFARAPGCPIIG